MQIQLYGHRRSIITVVHGTICETGWKRSYVRQSTTKSAESCTLVGPQAGVPRLDSNRSMLRKRNSYYTMPFRFRTGFPLLSFSTGRIANAVDERGMGGSCAFRIELTRVNRVEESE